MSPEPGGRSVQIIAHRGYSAAAPENTLPAFERALAAGASGVEWDVRETADGVPVVLHDARLERTTDGTGPVSEHSWGELQSLDAGAWFGKEFRGTRIPSVEEVLARVAERADALYPELKPRPSGLLLRRLVELFDEFGVLEKVTVQSFDWEALEEVGHLASDLALGYVADEEAKAREALDRARARERDIAAVRAELLLDQPRHAEQAAEAGVGLSAWTVKDVGNLYELLELGVSRVETDEVERLVEAVG